METILSAHTHTHTHTHTHKGTRTQLTHVQGSSHSSYTSVQLLFPVRLDTLKMPRDPLKLEAWSPKDPIKTLMGALIKHLNVGCSATPG